jgi:hypothetical protein
VWGGSAGTAPQILNISINTEVSDQFHAQAALPMGKDLQNTLTRKLGGPHSWSGHFREEKNLLPLPETKPQFLGCTACM